MIDIKMWCVIVLYNKKIEDSITFQSLSNMSLNELEILIVDNSSNKEIIAHNKKQCELNKIIYISMNTNAGLSKAYNVAIDYIKIQKDDSAVIIWMDDDTEIVSEYFVELADCIRERVEYDIFVPIIIGQNNEIWSPNRAGFLKNKFIKSKDDTISNCEFNAINSCMAVRLKVYNEYTYDERLFLDQVDHKFCNDQRNLGIKFWKMDTQIKQNFSQMAKDLSAEILWNRLNIRLKDIMIYGTLMGSKKYEFFSFVKCCGISIKLSLKVKSFIVMCRSIKLCFKLYFNTFK